jgi:hypothetical protein
MEKGLQVVKSGMFEGTQFDCYQGEGSDWYGTREQIGVMLGYAEPMESIKNIHFRNKERLDKFSTSIKLIRVEGNREVEREVTVYSFKGLLEICRYSNQPKADAVMDFLWDMADEVKRTGSYSVKQQPDDKLNLERRRLAIREREVNIKLAKAIRELAANPPFPLTNESQQILYHEAAKTLVGEALPALLPDSGGKLYSNQNLADELGVINRDVSEFARNIGIIPPEGEVCEFGRWKMTKAPHSSHECSQFWYSEQGREVVLGNFVKCPRKKDEKKLYDQALAEYEAKIKPLRDKYGLVENETPEAVGE